MKSSVCAVIFRVYDTDGNGKVTSSDMLQVLRDLSGNFLTDEQRQVRTSKPFYNVMCSYWFTTVVLERLQIDSLFVLPKRWTS